jgi:hypothetical protein
MPRFVLLKHMLPADAARGSHWDVMLESGGVLRTWALEALPAPDREVAATQLADHRLAYLDHEGPVSKNRGRVERLDRGDYTLASETADRLEIEVEGQLFKGRATLYASRDDQRWRFVFRPGNP